MRVPAEVETPSEIGDFVVKVRDRVPVYVRDVATVVYGFEDESTRARIDMKPAVTLTIEKRTGANIIEVADMVKADLDRWSEMLPGTIDFTIVGDQSKDIRSMVSELENNIVAGLLLVIAVLMASLGLRNSLFVAIAIPLSMLISFSVIQVMGYTLNMIVLFSLILVLGMLVDNAIVIVENIYRHREAGEDGPTAAMNGTREVVAPVISSTITTCCAFTPMLFWPGMMGDFMSYLPITLIIGLTASLVVALVFNPTLCAYFMAPPKETAGQRPKGRILPVYERLLKWVLSRHEDHGGLSWFLRNWLLMGLFGVGLTAGITLVLLAFTIRDDGRAGAGNDRHSDDGGCHRIRAPGCALARVECTAAAVRLDAVRHRPALWRALGDGGDSRRHGGRVRRARARSRVLPGDGAEADLDRLGGPERHDPRHVR